MSLSGEVPYKITTIDYWEKDAFLNICGLQIYFQFSGKDPTIEDAMLWFKNEVLRIPQGKNASR